MSTTTFAAIRAQFMGSRTAAGVLQALTPTLVSDKPFSRIPARRASIQALAEPSSAWFRRMQMRSGRQQDPNEYDPSQILREQSILLVVAYPVLVGLYGDGDIESMEDVIDSDAGQLRDALVSPGNLISGFHGFVNVGIEELDDARTDIWFLNITATALYYRAQTLT